MRIKIKIILNDQKQEVRKFENKLLNKEIIRVFAEISRLEKYIDQLGDQLKEKLSGEE